MATFERPQDREAEQAVADRLEKAWKREGSECEMVRRPRFDPIDWECWRTVYENGKFISSKLSAFVEVKCRTHIRGTYPTMLMSLAKFTALFNAAKSFKVPSFFVVRFSDDELCYVDVSTVDARSTRLAGREPRPGSTNDQEQMIDVPLDKLTVIKNG